MDEADSNSTIALRPRWHKSRNMCELCDGVELRFSAFTVLRLVAAFTVFCVVFFLLFLFEVELQAERHWAGSNKATRYSGDACAAARRARVVCLGASVRTLRARKLFLVLSAHVDGKEVWLLFVPKLAYSTDTASIASDYRIWSIHVIHNRGSSICAVLRSTCAESTGGKLLGGKVGA